MSGREMDMMLLQLGISRSVLARKAKLSINTTVKVLNDEHVAEKSRNRVRHALTRLKAELEAPATVE